MMMQRMSLMQLCTLAFLVGLAVLVTSHPALAQTGGSANTAFACAGGQAVGSLYTTGLTCPTTMTFNNIFSYIVCNMEQLSGNLMGVMFCGMIQALTPAVSAVLLLAVVIFGIGFTIGVIPATAREFQMFLIKIMFVWAFATQSDYLIGIAYAFFINGIRDGVAIALSNAQTSLAPGATVTVPTTGSAVYAQLDTIIAGFIHYATDYVAGKKDVIDPTDPNAGCKNALFAVMAIMAIAFPPVFYLAIAMLAKIVLTFLRAVFGYLYALVGITFLLTLAPFFLSFFLFRQTRGFFDKWIGYLASFALQIILLFAFLSFILSINVSSLTSSFTALVVRNQQTLETTTFRAPWDYCTLCQFEEVTAGDVPVPLDPLTSAPIHNSDLNFLSTGKLQCKKFQGTLDAKTGLPVLTKDKNNALIPATDGGYPAPITVVGSVSPDAKKNQSALLTFMTAGLLSLTILAYIVESLLGYVGSLAQNLATGLGGYSAPQLGGGTSLRGDATVALPFESNMQDFSGGFARGFKQSSNSLGATGQAFKEGSLRMLGRRIHQGAEDDPNNGNVEDDPNAATVYDGNGNVIRQGYGIKTRITDWLADPAKLKDPMDHTDD